MSSTISAIVLSDTDSWVVSSSYRNKSTGSEIILGLIFLRLISPRVSYDIQDVASAFNVAFWWSIGFTVIAIIPALLLSGVNIYRREEKQKVSGEC